MAIVTRTVRISKSWHVDVELEYGDTEESIRERALALHVDTDPSDSRLVTVLPAADS